MTVPAAVQEGILSEIILTASRSGGPGGQNVNKVESRVQLSWNISKSVVIPADVRERFLESNANRTDSTGVVHLSCSIHRSQLKNRETVVSRLLDLIEAVWLPPRKRFKTRPTFQSTVNRLETKRKRSTVKHQRQRVRDME